MVGYGSPPWFRQAQPAREQAQPAREQVSLRRAHRRFRFRRQRQCAAPRREGVPRRGDRSRTSVRRPRVREDELASAQVAVGAEARAVRDSAHPRTQRRDDHGGSGRRRWLAQLRQHPVQASDTVLHRPPMEPHHRLGGRAHPALRAGSSDAGRRHQSHCDRIGSSDADRRRTDGRGRYLHLDAGRRVLRCQDRPGGSAGRDRPGSVLRWSRTRADRVHRMWRVHDRVSGGREEHPDEELPRSRRAQRRNDHRPHHRRRTRAACRRYVGGRDQGLVVVGSVRCG